MRQMYTHAKHVRQQRMFMHPFEHNDNARDATRVYIRVCARACAADWLPHGYHGCNATMRRHQRASDRHARRTIAFLMRALPCILTAGHYVMHHTHAAVMMPVYRCARARARLGPPLAVDLKPEGMLLRHITRHKHTCSRIMQHSRRVYIVHMSLCASVAAMTELYLKCISGV